MATKGMVKVIRWGGEFDALCSLGGRTQDLIKKKGLKILGGESRGQRCSKWEIWGQPLPTRFCPGKGFRNWLGGLDSRNCCIPSPQKAIQKGKIEIRRR